MTTPLQAAAADVSAAFERVNRLADQACPGPEFPTALRALADAHDLWVALLSAPTESESPR